MVNRTRPRSTIVICSCGCECTAVTTCGAKRSRQTIRRSPQIIWRSMPSRDALDGNRRPVAVLERDERFGSLIVCSVRPVSRPEPLRREFRLDVDDAVLTIVVLAVRRHHPEEVDGAARRRDVRVVALRHQHDVAFAHDGGDLGLARVGVDQLHAERRRRHVDVEVGLFEHRGVLVRRPRRPVARLAEGDAGHDAAGLDVLADQHVQLALARSARRPRSAAPDPCCTSAKRTNCTGCARVDRRGDLGEVAAVGARRSPRSTLSRGT